MRAKSRMRLLLLILGLIALGYTCCRQSRLNSSETLDTLLTQELQQLSSTNDRKPTPTPRLIMYVQTFSGMDNKSLSLLPLANEKTGVTHVIIGALHLHSTPGKITLNDDPTNSPLHDHIWSDVKKLQENGIKVMAMLGGAAQGSYRLLNGTDDLQFDAYYLPLLNLIKQYNLDGLDIDIEEEVHIDVPLRLLNALYRDMGPEFILTMVPLAAALNGEDGGNLSGFSYSVLDSHATVPGTKTKLVHWYNAMFYGGFARSTFFYRSVIGSGWDPSRIILGVTDSAHSSASPRGFVDLTELHSTIHELRVLYPTFGGVYGWEYFDAGTSDEGNLAPWQWVQRVGRSLFEGLAVSGGDKGV